MDDNEHDELMNYLESLEALDEADKELEESINPTTQEIIMDNKIIPVNTFVTPDSLDDLSKRIESFSANEKAVAWLSAMMAWNLACKIVNEGGSNGN